VLVYQKRNIRPGLISGSAYGVETICIPAWSFLRLGDECPGGWARKRIDLLRNALARSLYPLSAKAALCVGAQRKRINSGRVR
jgi:hypothetical protein